jgi:hypothetical protein
MMRNRIYKKSMINGAVGFLPSIQTRTAARGLTKVSVSKRINFQGYISDLAEYRPALEEGRKRRLGPCSIDYLLTPQMIGYGRIPLAPWKILADLIEMKAFSCDTAVSEDVLLPTYHEILTPLLEELAGRGCLIREHPAPHIHDRYYVTAEGQDWFARLQQEKSG